MPDLTDAELAELERLEAAATKGPWSWEQSYEMGPFVVHWAIKDPANAAEGRVTSIHLVSLSYGRAHGEFGFLDDPDVLMVPAARNAVPRLIDEVRRLRAENAELRKRSEWRDSFTLNL